MAQAVFVETLVGELLARAGEFKSKGWRFVQCCASRDGEAMFELLYSFCDDTTNEVANLRLRISANDEVPSLGSLYPAAFMFENEMHDLFGITVTNMNLDFRGGFYHLHIPAPMAKAQAKAKPAKPAAPVKE